MTEAECLAVIETFGRELTEKRGVRLQCFLWDDGWDDPTTLWQVDKQNFPRGFAPLVEAAKKYHSRLGVWMSPWGGYGDTKTKRVEQGRKQGFETVGPNFSMAGPNYYRRFLETSLGWNPRQRERPLQVRRNERRRRSRRPTPCSALSPSFAKSSPNCSST